MKIYTVGTGSSGNCYLLKHNDNYIALDCGCKWKDVLVGCNFHPIDIDIALVTHSHSDHSKYAKEFIKGGIPVYSPDNVKAKTMVKYKNISFVPFVVPHDVTCYGYLIKVDGQTIVYMTDFGYCRYTFKSWNVDTFIIACNYNILPDAEDAKYAHVVLGHSSLETVKDILEVNKSDFLKNVILCHVSANADTEQMVTEVKQVVGDGVNVSLAKKGTVIYL